MSGVSRCGPESKPEGAREAWLTYELSHSSQGRSSGDMGGRLQPEARARVTWGPVRSCRPRGHRPRSLLRGLLGTGVGFALGPRVAWLHSTLGSVFLLAAGPALLMGRL